MRARSGVVTVNKEKYPYTIRVEGSWQHVVLQIFCYAKMFDSDVDIDLVRHKTATILSKYDQLSWTESQYKKRGPLKDWEVAAYIDRRMLLPTLAAGGNRREDYV